MLKEVKARGYFTGFSFRQNNSSYNRKLILGGCNNEDIMYINMCDNSLRNV